MNKMESYPKLTADILNRGQLSNSTDLFLFNAKTNKGFSLQGLAALLCKDFDGKKTLAETIIALEAKYELEPGKFKTEITNLVHDLENNGLLNFSQEPQA